MGKNHHKVLTELNLTQTLNAFLHNKTKPPLMFTWASPAREKCLKHFFNTLQFFKEPKAAWAPAGYAPARGAHASARPDAGRNFIEIDNFFKV